MFFFYLYAHVLIRMLLVLKAYKTHVLFSKGEAAPSHISNVMDTLQFCKLLSFSLVC